MEFSFYMISKLHAIMPARGSTLLDSGESICELAFATAKVSFW